MAYDGSSIADLSPAAYATAVAAHQVRLAGALRRSYDYIVCGSGSSGSVVARRLAEDPDCHVLLLEAGGVDTHPDVSDPRRWFTNLGTERDWGFVAEPNPHLGGRRMPLSMGKLLGGGSSINAMIWSRGHRDDWNYFSMEAKDPAWNYRSVLDIYKRIEDWRGAPDPERRGHGGLVHVEAPVDPNPLAPAMVQAAAEAGIPSFADANGSMMEGEGGAALTNLRIRNGRRQSIFRTYVYPLMAQQNLTVLTNALVVKICLRQSRAIGVEMLLESQQVRVAAREEVIISLGAIQTPKLLMQSGIGDSQQLRRHGIPCHVELRGVGRNFQDHLFVAGCIWQASSALPLRNNVGEATLFWKSDPRLESPDLQPNLAEIPLTTPETQSRYAPPPESWTIVPGLVRPASRGEVVLTGPGHDDPVAIRTNFLSEEQDMTALLHCVDLVRELGNSKAMAPFRKREVMPGPLQPEAMRTFVKEGLNTYWHQSCTAKIGVAEMSVVDSRLRVYGVQSLRVADASIMPRVTTGNTMAPCVVIGEQLGRFLQQGRSGQRVAEPESDAVALLR